MTTATDSPTPTVESSTETHTPTPPLTVARCPLQGTEWTVTITRVIDGETLEAEFPNGEINTFRLLGVDTPETILSGVSPEEFEEIPDTTSGHVHLFTWGERATDSVTNELAGKRS